jgi:hypothetical protein
MSRWTRAVLISAAVLLSVVLLAVALGGVVTQTGYGREKVRSFLSAWLAARVNGTMYVGRISGGFLGGVNVDSLEIRDDRGELFVASGPATVRYDLRDLFDRRTLIRRLELTRPVIHLREYRDGTWNFRRIFPGGQPAPIGTRRGFGDFVYIDSAAVHGGLVMLTLPWRVPRGTTAQQEARLLAQALADTGGNVRQLVHEPGRVFSWSQLDAELAHVRLAHPDTAGRRLTVVNFAANMSDPPFPFSEARGEVRQLGDSLWVDSPHWRLPGSAGRARGKIVWGGGRPNRYDIRFIADTLSLSDLYWIDPTFPTQGGGRAALHIRNASHNERVVEFAVSDIDVRTYDSHLTGRVVVDPMGPILSLRDLAMQAAPLDFALLRSVNGGPFPYNWRGSFTGTVVGPGGRLDRFNVTRADLVFRDANVPGATASALGSGMLDITDPGLARFRGFRLDVRHLDLRTPRAVIPDFAELDGSVFGTVTLDSVWTDVRFSSADLVHRDGDGPVTHLTGRGRVTLAEPRIRYDLDLFARQLSLTTLGRSYPALPLTGEFRGPIRVSGESNALQLSTTLDGNGARLTYDGLVDSELPVYGATGAGTFTGADLSTLLRRERSPASNLTGQYDVALSGADRTTTEGRFDVRFDSSVVRDVRINPSFARGRISGGVVDFDSVAVELDGGAVAGAGTVALAGTGTAALRFAAAFDSLAAARQLLSSVVDSLPELKGVLRASGELRTGERVGVTGELGGRRLVVGDQSAEAITGLINLSRGGGRISGTLSVAADTVDVRGYQLRRIEGAATLPLELGAEGAFRATVHRARGEGVATVAGRLARQADTSTVYLDTLITRVDAERAYRSTSTSSIRLAGGFLSVDSLILAPVRGPGTLVVRDLLLSRDTIGGFITTRDADLALLVGVIPELLRASGSVHLELALAGSRSQPRSRGRFAITNGTAVFDGGRYERLTANIDLDDSWLRIRELSAETPRGGNRRGTARMHGSIDLSDGDNPVFDLEATARGFRALDRRGFATLDVSTGPALQLVGPYRGGTLRGAVIVDEGTIYLPERLDKEIADVNDPELLALVDTVSVRSRSLLPSAPTAFVSNLRLDDVNIVLGDDVWLRSSEANVELGGSLRVTRGVVGGEERPQLALVGTLNAIRGTYVLNLAVAQPTFHVERGTLRFFGTPDLNPALDIRAIHTVRQPRRTLTREDVRILVAITGTLHSPQLSLSSADSLVMSQSDLLSYLVTGEPAFALSGTSTEYAEQLLTLGGRLAGTFISARIPRSLFDIVEVRTAAVRLDAGSSSISSSYLNTLYNTRVILGKQLSERWYVGLSTGLCRANFTESLGLHLEYRFSSTYFAQGGVEPGSGDVACVGTTTARTFQQTPPQLGVDLFRSWRF